MNFDFLKPCSDLKKLYNYCSEAEEFALLKPDIATASARKAMEYIVKMIHTAAVKTDSEQQPPTVFEMITDYRFQTYVGDETLIGTMHYIRKMGNIAAHDGGLTQAEALKVLEQLHFLAGEFAILLGMIKDYPAFIKPTEAPKAPAAATAGTGSSVSPEAKPEATPVPEKVTVEPEIIAKYAPRLRETKFNVTAGRNEEENKKLFLHACLREAGWPVVLQQNQSLPGSAGINMLLEDGDSVDYILYGRDNKPLAVVEFTATQRNIVEGRTKGISKANKLAVKYGYKPVVYYTNGYNTYVIDQLGYKPRRVFQFHSLEELELMKLRASMRQDISNPVIDDSITNRKYQKEAITAACRAFMSMRRHSLLVMATGTGKTRISISFADILLKNGWVKNILFLADRTSLVRQAHKNFNKLLPSVTTSVYSGGSMNRDPNARIIFSTYQTMINLINDDTREFSIGRFDLIIIDEAHRSIFSKYAVLFHYFDALMLGLTATPRSDDNKSTYEMFQLQNGQPDYAYELTEAIADKYLVGFQVVDRTTAALQRGIEYDSLSEKEKRRFEDSFAEGDDPVDFSGTIISRKQVRSQRIINLGTINAMLGDLMKHGLKINGGDKLGKTIIFASSHTEAEQIVLQFQKLYPALGGDFCKLIDAQTPNNLALIDSFGERDQLPQIAVSVDMLDTGIDVPDVLNLVFYKRVEAKIKFLQMIGRGTRLCPNVFGPGMDKKGFLIFDYYDNFNYFRATNTWTTVDETANGSSWAAKAFNQTPQSVLINECRLGILSYLLGHAHTKFDMAYRDKLQSFFIRTVQGLCNDDIEVMHNMAYVSKYRTAEQWDDLEDEGKRKEIEARIIPLFPSETEAVKVKTFDLMMLVVEEQVPFRIAGGKDPEKIRHGFGNVFKKISKMMAEVAKLKTIPAVLKEEKLITAMQDPEYLLSPFSLERCEQIREKLRKLVEYIPDDKSYYIIDAKDYIVGLGENSSGGTDAFPEFVREKTYAEKAKEYIAKGSPALAKLRNLDELTDEEKTELNTVFTQKLGTAADYATWAQNKPMLPFLRTQVGIADEAIQTKFGSFLNTGVLTQTQLTYMEQIISYARGNGDIAFLDLQRVSPFCDVDIMALFGTSISYIKTLINGLHRPVME